MPRGGSHPDRGLGHLCQLTLAPERRERGNRGHRHAGIVLRRLLDQLAERMIADAAFDSLRTMSARPSIAMPPPRRAGRASVSSLANAFSDSMSAGSSSWIASMRMLGSGAWT
jgi:hypothetical protein